MKYLITMGLVLGITSYCVSANAFTLVPRAMACMLYFRSDAVFTGEVLSAKEDHQLEDGEDFVEGWFYTLKVIKAYRGVKTSTIQVYTSNDSGRLTLHVGKKYLLFADRQNDKLSIGDDEVSGELKNAQVPLKDLDTILNRKAGMGGDIYGRVVQGPFNETEGGLGGVYVTLEGPAGNASAVSNSKGWFHVHVPAGDYSAKASAGNLVFESQDIAWENSENFTVPDGGCAEIQLYTGPITHPEK